MKSLCIALVSVVAMSVLMQARPERRELADSGLSAVWVIAQPLRAALWAHARRDTKRQSSPDTGSEERPACPVGVDTRARPLRPLR